VDSQLPERDRRLLVQRNGDKGRVLNYALQHFHAAAVCT
jgi:hypothetical protein